MAKNETNNNATVTVKEEQKDVAQNATPAAQTPDGNAIVPKEKLGAKLKRKTSEVMNRQITFTPAGVLKGIAAAGAAVGGAIVAIKLKAKLAVGSDPGEDPGVDPATPDKFDNEPSE